MAKTRKPVAGYVGAPSEGGTSHFVVCDDGTVWVLTPGSDSYTEYAYPIDGSAADVDDRELGDEREIPPLRAGRDDD